MTFPDRSEIHVSSRSWWSAAFAVMMMAACAAPATAEPRRKAPASKAATVTSTGVPNALQGFSQNRDQPVQIEADNLEVRDKDKVATFTGNVHVVQGDTDLHSKSLRVYYDDENAKPEAKKTVLPGAGGEQKIRKLEALGGVIVTQKDQTATGDKGVFDMHANTVTLLGNVIVSQGDNVLHGDKLIVNLTTSVSKVEAGSSSGGRVMGIFKRGAPETGADKPKSDDKSKDGGKARDAKR